MSLLAGEETPRGRRVAGSRPHAGALGNAGARAVLALLLASAGLGIAAGPSAQADDAAADPAAADAKTDAPAFRPARPRARGPSSERFARREQRQEERREWWAHAREVLFADIALSPEQSRGVDAIIESQLRVWERMLGSMDELRRAPAPADEAQTAKLRADLRAAKAELRGHQELVEEMRELLTEAQRPTFDLNRARLVAQGQKSRGAPQQDPDQDDALSALRGPSS